uniref:Uncharacterized protein n=1 Tax=Angiostrongylus cantonensis TaxID=6313 RepID=A0A0K0DPU3_ANGCA
MQNVHYQCNWPGNNFAFAVEQCSLDKEEEEEQVERVEQAEKEEREEHEEQEASKLFTLRKKMSSLSSWQKRSLETDVCELLSPFGLFFGHSWEERFRKHQNLRVTGFVDSEVEGGIAGNSMSRLSPLSLLSRYERPLFLF